MRYFLKIILNALQLSVHRIEPREELTTTDELIVLIAKKLNLTNEDFILKLLHEQNKLKIVKGWPLEHYGLRSGMQIEVELLCNENECISGRYGKLNDMLLDNK
jgi:hypothetical protein